MSTEPETKVVDRLMLVGAVVVVVAYGWLISRSADPGLPNAKQVAKSVTWVTGGTLNDWSSMRASHSRAVARVAYAINEFNLSLHTIGEFPSPPALLIYDGEPNRYRVSEDTIEISERIAIIDNQLVQALCKSWLLQHSATSWTLFRLEFVSRAMANRIQSSDEDVPDVRDWLKFAKPYRVACASPERNQNLLASCGESDRLDPFSFVPLLDAWINRVFAQTSPFDQLELLAAWSKTLALPVAAKTHPWENNRNLEQWQGYLREEMAQVFPADRIAAFLPEGQRDAFRLNNASAELAAHLAEHSPFQVDLALQSSSLKLESDSSKLMVITDGTDAVLEPAAVRFPLSSLKNLQAGLLVWESCKPARLVDFLSHTIEGDRFLYLQDCGKDDPGLTPALAEEGLYGLARVAPTMPFLQLHRTMSLLAEHRGEMDRYAPLTDYMEIHPSKTVSLMGLESAVWQRDVKAYRVLGAIEAVEFFRSPTHKL